MALLLGAGGTFFYKKVYIPKISYERVSPTKGDLFVEVYGIGNVGAKNIYPIMAQTGGKILLLLSDEGEWVKKGDLLVTIDSIDIPQRLEEAQIAVKKAISENIATQKEMGTLFAQKRLFQITYKRYARLKKQSFVSKSEFDKAKADLDVIDAQIVANKAHIDSAKMEITRAKKAVEGLKEKLSRYKVYAPVDGYVIARRAEVGQSVLPSQTILEIVDPKSVWIKTYIDEKISGSVKLGQKAEIRLRSQEEKIFKGTVKRIVAQSDAVTQEREVDVAFDVLPIPFYMNEQAQVSIASKTYRDVIKIPTNVLAYYKEKRGVWVENGTKANFVELKIVARGVNEVAVEGLEEDVTLLVASSKNKSLKDGMSIR